MAKLAENLGAGEVVVNSIRDDGRMNGYDLEMAKLLRNSIKIPISIMGGAGNLEDIKKLSKACGIVGAVASSIFVFKGALKAVLINYPSGIEKDDLQNSHSVFD